MANESDRFSSTEHDQIHEAALATSLVDLLRKVPSGKPSVSTSLELHPSAPDAAGVLHSHSFYEQSSVHNYKAGFYLPEGLADTISLMDQAHKLKGESNEPNKALGTSWWNEFNQELTDSGLSPALQLDHVDTSIDHGHSSVQSMTLDRAEAPDGHRILTVTPYGAKDESGMLYAQTNTEGKVDFAPIGSETITRNDGSEVRISPQGKLESLTTPNKTGIAALKFDQEGLQSITMEDGDKFEAKDRNVTLTQLGHEPIPIESIQFDLNRISYELKGKDASVDRFFNGSYDIYEGPDQKHFYRAKNGSWKQQGTKAPWLVPSFLAGNWTNDSDVSKEKALELNKDIGDQ